MVEKKVPAPEIKDQTKVINDMLRRVLADNNVECNDVDKLIEAIHAEFLLIRVAMVNELAERLEGPINNMIAESKGASSPTTAELIMATSGPMVFRRAAMYERDNHPRINVVIMDPRVKQVGGIGQ